MSDSRRKTPIFGNTTAATEKPYKTREHRRERRAVTVALKHGVEPPAAPAFGNPWAGDKDGKHYRSDAAERDMRK